MNKFNQLLKAYGCEPIPYGRKRPCSERSERERSLGQRPSLPNLSVTKFDRYRLLLSGIPVARPPAPKTQSTLYTKFLQDLASEADGSGSACADVPAAVEAEINSLFLSLSGAGLPPCTNRGVTFESAPPENNCISLFNIEKQLYIQPDLQKLDFDGRFCDFDWYQGTIFFPDFDENGSPITGNMISDLLFYELCDLFPEMKIHREIQKSVNRYETADVYYDMQDPKRRTRLLMVEFGGYNPGAHCTTSGYYSARVSTLLRNYETRPSRVDIAIDDYQPKDREKHFDRVSKKLLKYAKANSLKISFQGDWYTGQKGRTLYIGSRESVVQLCVYEKGLQLHGDIETAPAFPYWTRYEFRFRPDKRVRSGLHKNNQSDWLGSTKWVREVLQLLSIDVSSTKSIRAPKQAASADRARFYLAKQYGATIEHWVGESGSFAKFSLELYRFLKSKNPELNLEICNQS